MVLGGVRGELGLRLNSCLVFRAKVRVSGRAWRVTVRSLKLLLHQ